MKKLCISKTFLPHLPEASLLGLGADLVHFLMYCCSILDMETGPLYVSSDVQLSLACRGTRKEGLYLLEEVHTMKASFMSYT